MAKKDRKESPSEEPQKTSAQSGKDDGGNRLYTIGSWAGHIQYQCALCAFDCLDDEQDILTHIQETHMPNPATRPPSGILIADKRGNEIQPEAQADLPAGFQELEQEDNHGS